MDALLTLLGAAGVHLCDGRARRGRRDAVIPKSTSFHDALYLRGVLGLRPAPEFEDWLARVGISSVATDRIPVDLSPALIGLG